MCLSVDFAGVVKGKVKELVEALVEEGWVHSQSECKCNHGVGLVCHWVKRGGPGRLGGSGIAWT